MRVEFPCVLFFLTVSLGSQEAVSEEDPLSAKLRFGIDSEVMEVLDELLEQSNGHYNGILVGVLAETQHTGISKAVYRLWDETEFDGGLDNARTDLRNFLDGGNVRVETVQAAISYLASRKDLDAAGELYELAEERNSDLAASAVRALGDLGEDSNVEILLKRLQDENLHGAEDLASALIITLGKMRYQPAADTLMAIVEDEASPTGLRWYACLSLGRIGEPQAFPVLQRTYYETEDAVLRSYALAGLAEFQDRNITDILVQALKRDAFWRVRVTAAEQLGKTADAGIEELLRYKAVQDPVTQVRIAALKALGQLDSPGAHRFLADYYSDETKGTEARLAVLAVMVEEHIPGTVEVVMGVMNTLWEKDPNRFLEFTSRDLSRADWKALEPLYERMLTHPNWLIPVYGIRGIRRNSLDELMEKVQSLDREGVDKRIRREVEK